MKNDIGGYIFAKLGLSGFISGVQTFQDRRIKNAPIGNNLIGILPGTEWATGHDQVLVVGAHWDTVPSSPGLDDNGSGVAAILEVARALHDANCTNKYTVIIVAFDLEEYGSDGSLQFIQVNFISTDLSVRFQFQ